MRPSASHSRRRGIALRRVRQAGETTAALVQPAPARADAPSARRTPPIAVRRRRLDAPYQRRRGISLIEVLMSIFIISIGIIGVLLLIYLAHYQADRGAIADRAAAAGRVGIESFKLMGMDNPATWRQSGGTLLSLGAADTGAAAPLELAGTKKYLIDPRGVARGLTAEFPAMTNATTSAGTVTMPRLTLYNGISLTATGNNMDIPQADQAFCLHDDLHFTVNDNDPAAVPVQTMEATSEKRFAARDFSWLATVVREQPGDQYTLSVAIVQGRPSGVGGTIANDLANQEAEFTCTFNGGGFSGGDVTLISVAATQPVLAALRPGQWLMLTHAERARWYRVIAAGEMYGGSTPPLSRDVTLVGRDWDTGGGYTTPKAVILMNTVGVYERTVRLKTNSLWQQ